MGVVLLVMIFVIGLFLIFVLFYRVLSKKKVSGASGTNRSLEAVEAREADGKILAAVITAAINQHKIQNSQR